MKISINQENTELGKAIRLVAETIFEVKGINMSEYQPKRTFLISVDGSPGADFCVDRSTWAVVGIGPNIVIKDLSIALLGEKVDPRVVSMKVAQKSPSDVCQNVAIEAPVLEEATVEDGVEEVQEEVVVETEVPPIKKRFLFPVYKE